MLFLHTSNHLENLAQQFAHVTRTPLSDVFQSEKVVVQNAGMARWLSLNVADLMGISANMDALFPAEFMWKLLLSVVSDVPLQDPCAPKVLRWRYFRILLQHETEHPELSKHIGHYISDEASAWDLASELSQLLDQTLFYRDDWVREWENNEDEISQDDWQALLWKTAITDNQLVHWLALQDQFVNKLESVDANDLPERVSFFSLSALSPGYLRLLGELGKKTDVHLFIINPCKEYWGDIQSEKQIAKLKAKLAEQKGGDKQGYYEVGNPLLASMGRQGRDFLDQLLDLPNVEEINDWKESLQPSTLLQKIQHDVLHLCHFSQSQTDSADVEAALGKQGPEENETVEKGSVKKEVVKSNDASLQIHACHSALREVEVLHDQLLDIIQNSPETAPADIVVMMPDIETYAPYIEAVFSSTAIQSNQTLPFSIADRNPATSQLAIEAMLKLLTLADSRFDVEAVFELLDYETIRQRFSLQEAEVIQCRELARATNIRWGISDKTRNKEGLPNTVEHTWRYALERMLLGYALSGDTFFNVDTDGSSNDESAFPILPYTEIEGSNAQILASLKQFTDVVFRLNNWVDKNYSITVWLEKIKDLIQNLFSEESQIESLFKTLEDIKQQIKLAELDDDLTLSFAVINKIIKNSLEEISGSENFLSKGITFCALMPMRSVPFKVVALLGMNDGEFPRQNKQLSFDRMAKEPRKGDRSRRDEDRYLFLESVLAAREKLLIFYTGQSIKDNADLPPSVLVSELLETMGSYSAKKETEGNQHLIVKHPLQAFSPRYFNADSPELFSYSHDYVALNKQLNGQDEDKNAHDKSSDLADVQMSQVFVKSRLPELGDEHKKIYLDDLIAFYQSPAREFLKKHFAIKTFDKELVLPVREPFALESFVDRNIRDQIARDYYSTQLDETGDEESEPEMPEIEKTEIENSAVINPEVNNTVQIGIASDEALLVSRAKGLLPHGEIGNAIYNQQQQIMDAFLARLPALTSIDNVDFSLQFGEFQLKGEINHLTEQGRVIQQSGKAYTRDYISVWLNHLVLSSQSSQQTSQQSSESFYYSPESQFSLSAVDAGEAKSQLELLLAYYWQGLHFPLKFFPKPAFKLYEKNQSKGLMKLAIKEWDEAFLGTPEKDKFENWLLYRAYDNDALFGEEFEAISELFFGEFYQCYNEI